MTQRESNIGIDEDSIARNMTAIRYCGAALVFLSSVSLIFLFVVSVAPYARALVGTETPDDIYQICLTKMKAGAAKAKDPVGQLMLSEFAGGMCEALRTECTKAPDGEPCGLIRQAVTNMIRS